ncbi:MAG TPA: MFS transporter [Smithellaceae bacterium]|nr:MFS transporter [Smithellaceae bacterium]HNT90958.1 MFS transporter [Smithellaceae bacterium]HNV64610.1 MFS transporter [Smithellaceae bacterium]HNZ31861.1 MFS transporter [Smithellaceae bacterium]HOF76918.1 MFS transporter [Smithellaceae bacterium]
MDCQDYGHPRFDCVVDDVCYGSKIFLCFALFLGFSEAGFFPCMILYLTYWFPHKYLARNIALFMTATTLAGVIGGPISGALLGRYMALEDCPAGNGCFFWRASGYSCFFTCPNSRKKPPGFLRKKKSGYSDSWQESSGKKQKSLSRDFFNPWQHMDAANA